MILNILIAVAMGSLLLTLVLGLLSTTKTGKSAQRRSNNLMWWRVALQAVAIVIIAIAFYVKRNGG